MKRPLIGLTCKLDVDGRDAFYKLDRRYPDAIEKGGGSPLMLPLVRTAREAREWLGGVGGVVFTGGGDINPVRWGEKKHPKARLLPPEKEESDFLYAAEALRRDLPILGICLGSQIINVALKGSLRQHIGESHRDTSHPVTLAPSRVRDIVGKSRPTVNSFHHQAIGSIGRGLRLTATAPDGVIEALESEEHRFVLAVQWHPERMTDQPEQLALFQALAAAARGR